MKSNVSDHLEIVEAVYKDACTKCVAEVSDFRDLQTIRSRVKEEGLSFLTITLPQFCKDFERSLAEGGVSPALFRNFRKNGAIPAFLQGMLGTIFDKETGGINDETIKNGSSDFPTIVESVRQICLTFKKVEYACTPTRVQAALDNFTETEQSFASFSLSQEDRVKFTTLSFVLWSRLLAGLCLDSLSPQHGPGATAERISGNQKYRWLFWHDRLEPYFPLIDSAYTLGAIPSEELEMVTVVPEELEHPVRVVTVPKTMKGPRVIAIEPCCMQFAQQGIRNALYKGIEESKIAGGHVNFRDQSINQRLALDSSKTGRFATIDLSDASDRVPLDLALAMFQSNPDFRDAIEACRSRNAVLPDGTIIGPLQKFASMGSALCFPVEAMYFYTLCVMALLDLHNLRYTYENCFKVSRSVYVYGDDIVVPNTNAAVILDYLQKYNCKVNTAKTFYSGRFRESCGRDAYDGQDVSPVYVHHSHPENRRQAKELISWTATANLFYKKGYWNTATLFFAQVERILGPLPHVSEDSSALGRVSFLGYRSIERYNSKLHRNEIFAWVPSPIHRCDELDGYAALKKSLSKLESYGQKPSDFNFDSLKRQSRLEALTIVNEPKRDSLHLEQSALHGAVALKRRWVPA